MRQVQRVDRTVVKNVNGSEIRVLQFIKNPMDLGILVKYSLGIVRSLPIGVKL
jgi:hypothetical protein